MVVRIQMAWRSGTVVEMNEGFFQYDQLEPGSDGRMATKKFCVDVVEYV